MNIKYTTKINAFDYPYSLILLFLGNHPEYSRYMVSCNPLSNHLHVGPCHGMALHAGGLTGTIRKKTSKLIMEYLNHFFLIDNVSFTIF
jgi:hypothetical protein